MVKEELEQLSDKLHDTFGKKDNKFSFRKSHKHDNTGDPKTSGWTWDMKTRQPEKIEAPYNHKDFV